MSQRAMRPPHVGSAWRHVIAVVLVAAAACLALPQARASTVQLPLTIYDQGTGLTSLSVVRLYEGHDGFLWVGTEKGLYRFDGLGFESIGPSRGFQTSEVVAMTEDTGNHLWVASRAGLQRRKDDGSFEWVSPGGKRLLVDRGRSLAADSEGGMLAVSGHRMLRLTQDARGEWSVSEPLAHVQALAPGDIAAVIHNSGTTWFGCGPALCRLRNGVLTRFGEDKGVPADKWLGLLASRDGSVWARGIAHVLRLPANASAFEAHDIPGGHMKVAASSIDIVEDRAGRILTRTDVGLARWDGARWQLFDPDNGLPSVGISSMVSDRDGMVWMGTYGRGVYFWSSADAVEDWTAAQGLSGSLVWSIARGDARELWVASEAGAEVIAPDDNAAHRAPITLPPPAQAHAVIADGKGAIWYFLFDGRVARYDTKTRDTRIVATLPYLIRGALMDRQGRLWAYTLGGLFQIDPLSGAVTRAAPDLIPSTMCSDATEDTQGRLWVACSAGLFRLSGERWAHVTLQPGESAGGYENVAVTPDGRLWLSALQPGLWVADASDADTLAAAPVADALLADTRFYFLRVDLRGRLWAGGGSGVDVLDHGTWARLTMRDGLLWDETNHGAFLADADGTVWIGAPVGLTHVLDPDQLLAPRNILPVIADVLYGDTRVAASATLPSRESTALVLHFGVANNNAGHPVRFRYRLPGVDGDWVETAQREVRYASLPPGQYTFSVQALDVNRRVASPPLTMTFTIAPPWWQTAWAYAGAAVLVLLALWGAWRWRMRVLIAHARRLEAVVEVRTTELRDALQARRMLLAHVGHDLRAPLNTILSAVRKWRGGDSERDYPRIIERHVHQQMALIDELLEFSRGELTGLQLEPAPGYLHAFLHEVAERAELLAERHGNHLTTHFDERLPALVVADFRRLGQVLMNLLGNAAKFTHGGRVALHASLAPGEGGAARIAFVVEDTGIGMDPKALEALRQPFIRGDNAQRHDGSGLGLAIVEQLLQHMRSHLAVEAVPSGGSRFAFSVVLPVAGPDDVEPELPPGEDAGEIEGDDRVVLVVEPHAPTRAILCDLLDGYGFHSVAAADGQGAARALQATRPAPVVTELQFPGGDGWRLLHAVREQYRDVPVLLYAATAPAPTFVTNVNFNGVLLKPGTAGEFMRQVMKLAVTSPRVTGSPVR
ncbi:ATP-binding protein [Luteibacter aegosomatissinici]|uniref:ATP-binding protein n=1 Tax=Luteibacter aegosomatissinici TaxID=2911539 RepID=UPI001FF8F104|nr:ATP-binding protein [Luteibacter aegosomatissinici]UPG93833.1 ATP-binding protein [Luteibacter aegosomatissinici]